MRTFLSNYSRAVIVSCLFCGKGKEKKKARYEECLCIISLNWVNFPMVDSVCDYHYHLCNFSYQGKNPSESSPGGIKMLSSALRMMNKSKTDHILTSSYYFYLRWENNFNISNSLRILLYHTDNCCKLNEHRSQEVKSSNSDSSAL